jgi:hypothetical protein
MVVTSCVWPAIIGASPARMPLPVWHAILRGTGTRLLPSVPARLVSTIFRVQCAWPATTAASLAQWAASVPPASHYIIVCRTAPPSCALVLWATMIQGALSARVVLIPASHVPQLVAVASAVTPLF